MRGDDDKQPAESSDTIRRDRAGSQAAEPRREGAGSQAEPHTESRRVASDDSAAHDRHDEGAPAARRRQELDRQQPLDASGNLAERVRATTFTADAKGAADADAKGAADADAKAPGRGARAGVDGEKATPILAALAQLRNKQSERARRGSAPGLRPVPTVGKPPPGRGLVGGGRLKDRRKPAAPKSAARGGPAPRF